MTHGPLDIVVITFAEPRFEGAVTAKLVELAQAGVIRVLDAAVVTMSENGVRSSLDIEDLPAEQAAILGFVDDGTRGLFDADDIEDLFEGMSPGSAVAALAIEHVWAVGLTQAIRDAGGELALEVRVPAVMADEAFATLANARE